MPNATPHTVDVPSAETSLVGQTVGNFILSRVLGKGGWGEVYLGIHQEIGKRVAIKVLQSHLCGDAPLAKRFLGEAKVLARIQHPNIVAIHDFGRLEDGRLFYVMEELKGCDLEAVLARRPVLSPGEALPYLRQICLGLQEAHDHGIVHRDLKPSNVFVLDREPLLLKLLDFGLAKILDGRLGDSLATQSGMVFGTPSFIAPEQAAGEHGRVSPQTDLYSLGVMLFRMLSGQLPFVHEAAGRVLAMHITQKPPSLAAVSAGVPADIVQLVDQCLEKDPEARPSSARILAEAFARACGEETCTGPGQGEGHAPEAAGGLTLPPPETPPDLALAATVATPTPAALTRASGELGGEGGRSRRRRLVAAAVIVGAGVAAVTAVFWLPGGSVPGSIAGSDGSAPHTEERPTPAVAPPARGLEPDSAPGGASADAGPRSRMDSGKARRVLSRGEAPRQRARTEKADAAISVPPSAPPPSEKQRPVESAAPALAPKAGESSPPAASPPAVTPPPKSPVPAPARKPRPRRIGEGTIPFE